MMAEGFAEPEKLGLAPRVSAEPFCNQESPQQTKPKKGPKRKVHEFRPFLWILVFFLRKTSTIHIRTFVPECPCEKFMNWPFFGLVCRGDSRFNRTFNILLCEMFRRKLPFLQNPKRSAKFWRTFGSPDPSFEDQLFSSHRAVSEYCSACVSRVTVNPYPLNLVAVTISHS